MRSNRRLLVLLLGPVLLATTAACGSDGSNLTTPPTTRRAPTTVSGADAPTGGTAGGQKPEIRNGATTTTTGRPTRDPESTTTTTAPPASPGPPFPEFHATFDGTVDEGRDLINWLVEREGRVVQLDLTFAGAPAETDSPVLWSNCTDLPAGEQPSVAHCEAWVLHIQTDGATGAPFRPTAGRFHLEGYFRPAGTVGPNQGILSLALHPVTDEAVGE